MMHYLIYILVDNGWEQIYEGADPIPAVASIEKKYSVLLYSTWTATTGWVSRYHYPTATQHLEEVGQ